jgi:peptidyl-prolyl cis-trans isomerase C
MRDDCASVRRPNSGGAISPNPLKDFPMSFPLPIPLVTGGAPVRRALALCVVAAAMVLAAPASYAQQPDPVVARVNGAEIHESDLAMTEEELGQNGQQIPAEAKREYLITVTADMMLLSKAAEDAKLGDSDEFKRRLANARTRLLMEQLLQAETKKAVTPEAMRKVYDDLAQKVSTEQEVRARHILVETEDEAKAVLAELKKGADFAALAKSKSKDPGSSEGGDLGYFTKDQMVPEFAEVAFKLEKGAISDPVKSQFGWHIIKVEDKRTRQIPEFDKMKDQIETFLARKAQSDLITKLRASAKIERVGDAGKPAEPKPAEQKK